MAHEVCPQGNVLHHFVPQPQHALEVKLQLFFVVARHQGCVTKQKQPSAIDLMPQVAQQNLCGQNRDSEVQGGGIPATPASVVITS